MRGNDRMIQALNRLLSEELTAINQYMVHCEIADYWGYTRIHEAIEGRAYQEMKHARNLIERLIFLDATPVIAVGAVVIGRTVPEILANDLAIEMSGINDYNGAIRLAHEVDDQNTAKLLMEHLKEEEAHVEWLEAQQSQIAQMGVESYLASQN